MGNDDVGVEDIPQDPEKIKKSPAGFFSRLFALIIDIPISIIFAPILFLIPGLVGEVFDLDPQSTISGILFLLFVLPAIFSPVLYFALGEYYYKKTIGKYFVGLITESEDGKKLRLGTSIFRSGMKIIIIVMPILVLFIIPFVDTSEGQLVHDAVVGSRVMSTS